MNGSEKKSSPFIRPANENDALALERFYLEAFELPQAAVEVYVKLAIFEGKTYVYDAAKSNSPFIVSALTVLTAENGEHYGAFGGTLPSLRGLGLFSRILSFVRETVCIKSGMIFLNPSERFKSFLQKRGFVYEALALNCRIEGEKRKPLKLFNGYCGSATYHFLRGTALGSNGLSCKTNSLICEHYISIGNMISRAAEGYVAFSSAKTKGKYFIDEGALSVESFLKLPEAFIGCILPLEHKEALEKANVHFVTKVTAVADFNVDGRYINGLFK